MYLMLLKQYGVFASSETSIATVNQNVITAVKEGNAKITVTFDGKTKTINLTVNPKSSASDVDNPATGDSVLLYSAIAIVSMIGLCGCMTYMKKKRFN